MAVIKGWKLIRWDTLAIHYYICANGQVEYSPQKKYRIEKKNAFDPTIIHRRDEYREDSFDLEAVLTAEEYYTLMEFLDGPGRLYLEYTAYNTIKDLCVIPKSPAFQDLLCSYPQFFQNFPT